MCLQTEKISVSPEADSIHSKILQRNSWEKMPVKKIFNVSVNVVCWEDYETVKELLLH